LNIECYEVCKEYILAELTLKKILEEMVIINTNIEYDRKTKQLILKCRENGYKYDF